MTDTRRRLSGILAEPGLPPEKMADVAAKTGFEAPETVLAPAPPAIQEEPTLKPPLDPRRGRARPKVGRDHQFTTRIKPEIAEIMYEDSAVRNVPIAAVLEEALVDLKAKRERQEAEAAAKAAEG